MLNFVFNDIPNFVTLCGGISSSTGVLFAYNNNENVGFCFVLIALLLDHLDGYLARKLEHKRNINIQIFGSHFDCFVDFITKGIFPIIILFNSLKNYNIDNDTTIFSFGYNTFILYAIVSNLLSITIRYSYEFTNGGGEDGLSPDYNIVLLCILRYILKNDIYYTIVPIIMIILNILNTHNSRFNLLKIKGLYKILFLLFICCLIPIMLI